MTFFPRAAPAALSLGVLIGLVHVPPAQAGTLPSLGVECLSYSFKDFKNSGSGDKSAAADFQAALGGAKITLQAGQAEAGSSRKMTAREFGDLNAVAAYLAMTGYNRQLSAACRGIPYPELADLGAGVHELKWRDAVLRRPDLTLRIKNVEFGVTARGKDIVVRFKAEPIATSRALIFPKSVSGRATLAPSSKPPYALTLDEMRGDVAGSEFYGAGRAKIGTDLPHSTADLHLSIHHIGPVMKMANETLSAQTNTALLIARLLATREDDDRLGWTAKLENGQITLNGIKLPMAFAFLR